jgi:hypothetical protein
VFLLTLQLGFDFSRGHDYLPKWDTARPNDYGVFGTSNRKLHPKTPQAGSTIQLKLFLFISQNPPEPEKAAQCETFLRTWLQFFKLILGGLFNIASGRYRQK